MPELGEMLKSLSDEEKAVLDLFIQVRNYEILPEDALAKLQQIIKE